jgi:hypothetical protein
MLFITKRTYSLLSVVPIIIISQTLHTITLKPRTQDPTSTMFPQGSLALSKTWVFSPSFALVGVAEVSRLLMLKDAHLIDSHAMLYLFLTNSR